nr:hypothetical protein [Ktedonobacter racemifer]
MIRNWLTPPVDPQREETIRTICQVYHDAPALAKQGERTMSTDELTGVQALERKHPGLPLAPGHVQRREFEYERHGTRDAHSQSGCGHRKAAGSFLRPDAEGRRFSSPCASRRSH